jgi:hypothetical protein
MTTIASPPSLLTIDMIESVIAAMPMQGRIMLRLILLQYFDVTDEEILYIVADRPDPRCVAGTKPTNTTMTKESIKVVTDRRDQYRRQMRLKRERTWLQCDGLRRLAQLREAFAGRARTLLTERFAVSAESLDALRASARTVLPKPAILLLEQHWDADEITAEDYQRQRLSIEFQTQLRMAEKYRKRLDLAERERQSTISATLQDHEIAHVWGLPAGSLAARKVKYLSQYLHALQAALQTGAAATTTAPLDLWKETFSVLAKQPIERSLSTYDGLEKTESALIDKLTTMAWGNLAEESEVKFWTSLVFGASSNAMHSEVTRNLFGLQRLITVLNDMDHSPEAVDEELLKRTAAKPKDVCTLEAPAEAPAKELSEMQAQILNSMRGEDVAGRPSDKW